MKEILHFKITPIAFIGQDEEQRIEPLTKGSEELPTELTVAYAILSPYVYTPVEGLIAGSVIDIWSAVGKKLGVSLDFVDGGSFTGATKLVGIVLLKKSSTLHCPSLQVASGMASVMIAQPNLDIWQRYQVLDPSPQILERVIGFAVRIPVPVNTYHTIYRPFDVATWIFVVITTLSMYLTLWAIDKWHMNLRLENKSTPYQLASVTAVSLIGESMPANWFSVRQVPQGWLMLFFWLPLATILNNAYESILLSHLVAVSYEVPVDTFQEIHNRGLAVYTRGNTVISPIMKYHPRRIIRQVFKENLLKKGGYFDLDPTDSVWKQFLDGQAAVIATPASLHR